MKYMLTAAVFLLPALLIESHELGILWALCVVGVTLGRIADKMA